MMRAKQKASRLATRLAFFTSGFGYACWAPLVPFAKQRLQVDDGALGLLLLCIGVGSIAAMQITGVLSARYGSKPIILMGGLGLLACLPLLAVVATPALLGFCLLAFGAFLGSMDVAMNVHAVEVERIEQRPLMAGFHGFFSVGAFVGAGIMTFLLSVSISALVSSLLCAAVMLITMLIAWPRLLTDTHAGDGPLFVLPHGFVILLAVLAALTFLVEGAMLDWGALFMIGKGQVSEAQGGLGYMMFSIAMIVGRFGGDTMTARLGDKKMMLWGGFTATFGLVVLILAPIAPIAFAGFLLVGFGASNIVPILFRYAGTQELMPPALAISAMSTLGYAGILAGPACVGFIAKATDLQTAFWMLVALMACVPLCGAWVAGKRR